MEEEKDKYKWWREKLLIDGFNGACNNIAAIYLKVGDDSMSAIRFWTTVKGKLSHLSYIFCKPYPPGTEFKTVACSVTGALISIEVHIGKEGTKNFITIYRYEILHHVQRE